ncbi:unnamed protein product [Closterium sp. NIES-65]|nr:unnamed protein product [Closterium sp. NIES-65]
MMARHKQLVSKRNRFYEPETSSSSDDQDAAPPITRSRSSNKADNRAQKFANHVVEKAREVVPDDLVATIARNYAKSSYSNMKLMNHRGVGCEVDKDDLMSIEDDQWITDGVIDFHNVSIGAHQVIEVNGQGAHDVGLAGQFHQESEYPQDVAGTKLVLSELAKASNPNANMEFVDKMLTEADCIILREDKLPQQPNKEDCGIFVCQYLKTLVNTDFTTVLYGLWFQGVTPHQYRREMRRDLCAHACGDLIKQLADLGIEIPPQDEGRVTDEGAVVQERNAAMGEGRQAPVTRPVEDARVTEMMRRLATLNNDVRYLDASFTVLANFVGLRRDEVVTAATQLLLHGGHAGTGAKAEAGGTKNAPRTPQRPSAHKGRDDSSPEEDGVRNATRVVLASTFAACEPTSTLLQNPHLAHGTIPHWMFTRGMHQFGAGVPAGAGVWGDTRGKETVKAEEEEDLVSDIDDEEDDDKACASRYTGVKLDKASGKYGMKILIKEGGKRKQQRLGAYTTEEEGAFAYAAGAFVLRPRDKIPNTVSLSAAEKAMLRGCTKEDLQILVEARKWWRWRSWREVLDSVSSKLKRGRKRGGATGTSKRHRMVDSNTMATNEPEVPDNAESGGTAPVSEQGGGAKNNEQEERGEDTGAHENTSGPAA